MDTLYYSNYCKHCNTTLTFMKNNGLLEKVSFVCIDKRKQNPQGIWMAQQSNGAIVQIPHIVHSVPSLISAKNNYLYLGEDIETYFRPMIETDKEKRGEGNGEPMEISTLKLGAMEEGGTERMLSAASSIGASNYV